MRSARARVAAARAAIDHFPVQVFGILEVSTLRLVKDAVGVKFGVEKEHVLWVLVLARVEAIESVEGVVESPSTDTSSHNVIFVEVSSSMMAFPPLAWSDWIFWGVGKGVVRGEGEGEGKGESDASAGIGGGGAAWT
jgi:hypothetical protein